MLLITKLALFFPLYYFKKFWLNDIINEKNIDLNMKCPYLNNSLIYNIVDLLNYNGQGEKMNITGVEVTL